MEGFDKHSAPSIPRTPLVSAPESDLHRNGNVAAMLDRRAAARNGSAEETAATTLSVEQLRSRTRAGYGIESACSYFLEQERGRLLK